MNPTPIVPKRYVACAGCGAPELAVEHLLDGSLGASVDRLFGPWPCPSCGAHTRGVVRGDGTVETELCPTKTVPSRALCALAIPAGSRLVFEVQVDHESNEPAASWPETTQYLLEEHDCPDTVARRTRAVYLVDAEGNVDDDAHGLFRFLLERAGGRSPDEEVFVPEEVVNGESTARTERLARRMQRDAELDRDNGWPIATFELSIAEGSPRRPEDFRGDEFFADVEDEPNRVIGRVVDVTPTDDGHFRLQVQVRPHEAHLLPAYLRGLLEAMGIDPSVIAPENLHVSEDGTVFPTRPAPRTLQ